MKKRNNMQATMASESGPERQKPTPTTGIGFRRGLS
jgi:hypothetical protein